MNDINTKKVVDAGPILFRKRGGHELVDLFYFECGDGWFHLLHDLVKKLERLAAPMPAAKRPRVEQVKQKYGTLRFYISNGTNEMYDLIVEAERKSAETCEDCGARGTIRGRGWLHVACGRCIGSQG